MDIKMDMDYELIAAFLGLGMASIPLRMLFSLMYLSYKRNIKGSFIDINEREALDQLYNIQAKIEENEESIIRDKKALKNSSDTQRKAIEYDIKTKRAGIQHLENEQKFYNIVLTILQHKELLENQGVVWKKLRKKPNKKLVKEFEKFEKAEKEGKFNEKDILCFVEAEMDDIME